MLNQIINQVDENEIVKTLQEFIQIPSCNPPGEETECAKYAAKKMKEWGCDSEVIFKPDPERAQAVAFLNGRKGAKTLVLNGHIDTVPEGDKSQWTTDPFGGEVKDGKLYGRGSCDMKGGLVSAMMAMKVLQESDIQLNGNVILHFAYGEEKAEPGTESLLEQGFNGDWGIVLEPTKLDVAIAMCGRSEYKYTFIGKPCHASSPSRGINAIELASNATNRIIDYTKQISKLQHSFMKPPTCAVTMIEGGVKANIIPETCDIVVDRRTMPTENPTQVGKDLEELLTDLNHTTEIIMEVGPAEIPFDSQISQVVWKNTNKFNGNKPIKWGTPYGSDVRNFNDVNIPAVTFGPGDIAQAHTFDEFIDIKQMTTASKILINTIVDLLQ